MFTDGVLYVNVMTHQVEQYRGDYHDAVEQIAKQVEKDKALNAREERRILDAKEKINFFAQKGGKMRKLASKMRDEVEEAEENKVVVRKEDKTIKAFHIDFEVLLDALLTIKNIGLMDEEHNLIHKPFSLAIKKAKDICSKAPMGLGRRPCSKDYFTLRTMMQS